MVVGATNDAKDKIISCAKRKTKAPENLERKIDYILEKIAELDEMEQSKRDSFLNQRGSSQSAFFKNFYRSNNDRGYISMIDSAVSQDHSQPERKKVEQSIKQTYLDFAKDFGCEPKIEPYAVFVSLGQEERQNNYERRAQTMAKLKTRLESGDLAERHQELTSEPGRMFFHRQDRVYNCNKNFRADQDYHFYNRRILAPCSKAFTHHFANNEWELSSVTLDTIKGSDDFKDLQACIKERKAFSSDVEIEKVKISSSSSSLNNTGKASQVFGKKGFLALSSARATEAKDKILPLLLPESEIGRLEKDKGIDLDAEGLNGDGTSGPCPYYLDDNGSEKPKEGFGAGGDRLAELHDSKYVKIVVTFKSASKAVKKKVEFMGAKYACQGVKLKCAE